MKFIPILILLFYCLNFSQIQTEEKIIADGVSYKKIINTSDTLLINVLSVDLSKNTCQISSVKAKNLLNQKLKTSEMVEELKSSGFDVIGAINADFFEQDGELINNMLANGEIVKATKFTDSPFNSFVNSQFAISLENKLYLDQFVFSGFIILPDGTVESINRINSKADSNSISLYNKFQGEFTPEVSDEWNVIEFLLDSLYQSADTIFYKATQKFCKSGNPIIGSHNLILSANNKFSFYLDRNINVGDTLKILLNFNPIVKNIFTLVGGWPRLVRDGKNLILTDRKTEGVIKRFSENRHPRTGIGFSKDSTIVYLITVDGRQKLSRGMTLEEFADLMIQEGMYQGLNLDGGGSTTMIVEGEIVNSPSDITGERAVGNCLVVIKKK